MSNNLKHMVIISNTNIGDSDDEIYYCKATFGQKNNNK